MIAAIYARKSTEQNGNGDEHRCVARLEIEVQDPPLDTARPARE
jgi:hypothetical protein